MPSAPQPVQPAALLKLGVIVTQRGTLGQYSASILEGVRIAVAEHDSAGGHRIELLVRDDSGRVVRSAAMLRELQAEGVIAVIGPMYEDGVKSAAAARTSTGLVIVGPSLTQALPDANTYALNREDTAGAVLLGTHAASLKQRVGVLHDRTPETESDVAAFSRSYAAAGGAALTTVPFPNGTTTFATQIRRLRDARVQVLYLPLSPREIQQILPQLGYYGLSGVSVLGGETWTSDAMRRALPAALLDGVLAATVLPRGSPDVAWGGFENKYQTTYKRSLTTPIPALGYDAAQLVLRAVPRGRVTPGDISRGIPRTAASKGATGVLHVGPGAISRTPFLVVFHNGAWTRVASPGAP
ncbi:MAG: ABC transporter substrate-binding protein [Longimicrobiales bacterium]